MTPETFLIELGKAGPWAVLVGLLLWFLYTQWKADRESSRDFQARLVVTNENLAKSHNDLVAAFMKTDERIARVDERIAKFTESVIAIQGNVRDIKGDTASILAEQRVLLQGNMHHNQGHGGS